MPAAKLDPRISTEPMVETCMDSNVRTAGDPASGGDRALMGNGEIRIHGRGNSIIMSYYPSDGNDKPMKFYASSERMMRAIEDEIPVWVDERRLSKIQLASVKRVLATMPADVTEMIKLRDGRSMILVEKKK